MASKGAGVSIKWNQTKVLAEVKHGLANRLSLIGEHVSNSYKANLSTPVSKVRKKRRGRTSRGEKGSTYTHAVSSSRSKPGEYPRAETGLLMKNIFWNLTNGVGSMHVIIGTPSKYGAALELEGGRKGLRATLLKEAPMIKNILKMRGNENAAFVFTTQR